MEKETPEDEADSIKSLADKLATLNQRLIPVGEMVPEEGAAGYVVVPEAGKR